MDRRNDEGGREDSRDKRDVSGEWLQVGPRLDNFVALHPSHSLPYKAITNCGNGFSAPPETFRGKVPGAFEP